MPERQERGFFKRLNVAQQWLLAAGALASAVAAIIALGKMVLPEEDPQGGGVIRVLGVEHDTLKASLERQKQGSTAGRTVFASVRLAQTPPPSGEPPPEVPPDEQAPPEEPPDGEARPEGPDVPPDPSLPQPGEEPGAEEQLPDLDEQPPEVQELLDRDLTQGPIIQAVDLPDVDPSAAGRIEMKAKRALTGDPGASDLEVRQVLAGTRLKRLEGPNVSSGHAGPRFLPAASVTPLPPHKKDVLVPFGVTVDFGFKVTGFDSKDLEVRWSLFDANSGRRLPPRWLNDRPATRVTPDRKEESATGSFWVPLPKAFPGPFRVKVELFDPDNTRLDVKRSRKFR